MADRNHKVKIADYGAWSSPITAEVVIAEGGLSKSRFSFLQTCLNDNNEGEFIKLVWKEYMVVLAPHILENVSLQ